MGILAFFSESNDLAQLSNKKRVFWLTNDSSFNTTSGFYNSAKYNWFDLWLICVYLSQIYIV